MLSIKGTFQNGVAQPIQPVEGHNGQPVIITFLDEGMTDERSSAEGEGWEALTELVDACAVETGISDLARQHDHYLYGKPKKT